MIWCRPPPLPAACWPRAATRRKATRVLQRTWKRSPHPDLATAYAYARLGDSPRDRLERVKQLAQLNPNSIESAIAVATAAVEARDWGEARNALAPLTDSRLTQRVCTLMARIEGEEHGDKGRVREWLARAVNAPRDPAWTADGVVSDHWAPVSPVTGALDAFQWRVPVEALDGGDATLLAAKLDELVKLGAPSAAALPGAGDRSPIQRAEASVATPPAVADAPIPHEAAVRVTTAKDAGANSVQAKVEISAERTVRAVEKTVSNSGRPAAEVAAAAARAGQDRIRGEPQIYVPPRAPDDPGLDVAEDVLTRARRLRTTVKESR